MLNIDNLKNKMSKTSKPVKSDIYKKHYYLKAFGDSLDEYLKNLTSGNLDNRFAEVFRLAGLKEGERVLDIGCGRGELLYFSLLKGASSVVGIDYSEAALSIAKKAIKTLPKDLQDKARLLHQDISLLKLEDKYDCCFLTDVVEHLTQSQLEYLFSELKEHLSERGRIIIHTAPNINWIRFEYPLKRFFTIPATIIKRLRKKKSYSPPEGGSFLKRILSYLDLYYRRDYYNYSPHMHINEQSPASLKRLLKSFDFDFKIWCEDGSSNIISIICKRFWGPDIWAIVRKKSEYYKR